VSTSVLLVLVLLAPGCTCRPDSRLCDCCLPRELDKVNLPTYLIEPPDILLINAVRTVPKPPYKVVPLDALYIQVPEAPMTEPITGLYAVDPDGTVNLSSYGTVKVVGMTLKEAKAAIEAHLKEILKNPRATVSLGQAQGLQQIRGEHLVRPDGSINLGTYGDIRVAGLTLVEAKALIEAHLTKYLQDPEVTVDVASYNSKVYYVIFDAAGNGQQVIRLPITGNETVLDAISQVNGFLPVADMHRIWIARPRPACSGPDQVLPVDWKGIATRGRTETNYQILPGDRLYVHGDCMVATDTYLGRVIAPIERLLGFDLLGVSAVQGNRFRTGTGTGNGLGTGTGF
jgi:polysaccharide export outer membrane protein